MKISSKSKDRRGKKKSKRSKRRRDSSISSYSSSDSDDRSPPPRKRAFKKLRRSPCPADDDNWRKGKKKSEKKKSRNGRRRRRRRNLSSSSRSCSTCDPSYSDSARSPSPVNKKSKLGKRGRQKDRDLERRSSLTKRRKVSRSCSTCSDYASHSDSSRSHGRQKLNSKNLCDEEKTKNFKAHDGFPKIDGSDTKTNDGKAEKKRMKDIVDDVKLDAKEASSKIELSETDADGACDYGSLKEASSGMKNEVVADAGSGSLEAEKLEMVLKFKALENFKKYLGGNKKSESFKDAERSIETREVHQGTRDLAVAPHSSDIAPNEAGNTLTRNWKPRLSSVVIRPETNEGSTPECGASDSEIGQLVSRENHSGYTTQLGNENYGNVSRLSSKVVSNSNNVILSTREVSREEPESVNKCINEAGNDHSCGDNSNIAIGSKTMTASATKMDVPGSTSNEPADGSQFQHKSFSRTHDGEMVKVSYKVYIPKNSPALARRKLQR